MTEQELTVFLDLEWNCAAFTPEEASVSAPLSPKQWARIISRHPGLQEFCPFSEFTTDEWLIVLEKQLPFAWRCSCWKDFTPHQSKQTIPIAAETRKHSTNLQVSVRTGSPQEEGN